MKAKLVHFSQTITNFQTIPFITLLTVLFNLFYSKSLFGSGWLFSIFYLILGISLFVPKWRTTPDFWLVLFILQGLSIVNYWASADNHFYLIFYWSLVLFCVLNLTPAKQTKFLRRNAELIIGAVFLFAVIQKIISPDFLNGTTMYFLLITQMRFEIVGQLFGGDLFSTIATNIDALSDFRQNAVEVSLASPPNWVNPVSLIMTWYVLILEAVTCLFFLINNFFFKKFRHILLIIFGISIYTLIPVIGFGLILMILGFASLEETQKNYKLVYLGMMIYFVFAPNFF